MPLPSVYDITNAYRSALALTEETGGEITPDVEAALREIQGTVEEKVSNIVACVMEAESEAGKWKAAKERYAHGQKVRENQAKDLREFLKAFLISVGTDKVSCFPYKVSVLPNPTPSVTWEGAGEIPEDFRVVTHQLDRCKIADARKAGTLPDGFKVKYSRQLRII